MAEEVDATFQEVFSETSSTDSVRLLTWCISTATNPGVMPICYMSEALATAVQQGAAQWLPSHQSLRTHMSQPLQTALHTKLGLHHFPFFPCQTSPLLALPVGSPLIWVHCQSQHKKWDCSPKGAPDDQPVKRAYTETAEANVSSGHSTQQGDWKPCETPLEVLNNDMVALGGTGEHVSEDDMDCGDQSAQDESRENVANSDLKSTSGDCLTSLDTEEVAIRTA